MSLWRRSWSEVRRIKKVWIQRKDFLNGSEVVALLAKQYLIQTISLSCLEQKSPLTPQACSKDCDYWTVLIISKLANLWTPLWTETRSLDQDMLLVQVALSFFSRMTNDSSLKLWLKLKWNSFKHFFTNFTNILVPIQALFLPEFTESTLLKWRITTKST